MYQQKYYNKSDSLKVEGQELENNENYFLKNGSSTKSNFIGTKCMPNFEVKLKVGANFTDVY